MQTISVTIKDWQKFNPRADRANFSWFRFENKFFIKTFSWGPDLQRLFMYLCSCASQENKATFELELELASTLLRRKAKLIQTDLKGLEKFDVITTAPGRHDAGHQPSLLPATNETNVRDERDGRNEDAAALLPRLAALWNQHSGELPKVRECGSARSKSARARWDEKPIEGYWVEVITRMAKSDFCNGASKTGWRADFDFLIRPETHIKVLEGKYDDRKESAKTDGKKHLEQWAKRREASPT